MWIAARVVATASATEDDFVTVAKGSLPDDPFVVDIGAIQAAEIAQYIELPTLLNDAMFLRYDSVQELNRVAWVATEGVVRGKLDDLLAFGCREQQTSH